MRFGDTIAAIATPPGRSGRALLRLSGPRARDVLCAMDAPRDAMEKAGGPAAFGVRWRTGAGSLPVLAVCSRAPGSYTGEDTVELLVPGNPSLVRRLLEWALSHDQVRLAEPGEFTARAFLNGKLTLDQAEGVGRSWEEGGGERGRDPQLHQQPTDGGGGAKALDLLPTRTNSSPAVEEPPNSHHLEILGL